MSFNKSREYLIQALSYVQEGPAGGTKALACLVAANSTNPKWFNEQILAYNQKASDDYMAHVAGAKVPRISEFATPESRLTAMAGLEKSSAQGTTVDEIDNGDSERTSRVSLLNEERPGDPAFLEKEAEEIPGEEDLDPEEDTYGLSTESSVEKADDLNFIGDVKSPDTQQDPAVVDPDTKETDAPEYDGADNLEDHQLADTEDDVLEVSFTPEELAEIAKIEDEDDEGEKEFEDAFGGDGIDLGEVDPDEDDELDVTDGKLEPADEFTDGWEVDDEDDQEEASEEEAAGPVVSDRASKNIAALEKASKVGTIQGFKVHRLSRRAESNLAALAKAEAHG